MTDVELISRARSGDEAAWDELYRTYHRAVHNFISQRVGRDPMTSDDLFQDTFMKAARRIDGFDPSRGTFLNWLMGIALNCMADHGRRLKRCQQVLVGHDVGEFPEEPPRTAMTGELVNLAISQLPPNYQDVLQMKYELGLSLREMAAKLRISPESVGSLLYRARNAFKACYLSLARETAHEK